MGTDGLFWSIVRGRNRRSIVRFSCFHPDTLSPHVYCKGSAQVSPASLPDIRAPETQMKRDAAGNGHSFRVPACGRDANAAWLLSWANSIVGTPNADLIIAQAGIFPKSGLPP